MSGMIIYLLYKCRITMGAHSYVFDSSPLDPKQKQMGS